MLTDVTTYAQQTAVDLLHRDLLLVHSRCYNISEVLLCQNNNIRHT